MFVDSTGETVERYTKRGPSMVDRANHRIVMRHNGLKSAMQFDVVENHALGV